VADGSAVHGVVIDADIVPVWFSFGLCFKTEKGDQRVLVALHLLLLEPADTDCVACGFVDGVAQTAEVGEDREDRRREASRDCIGEKGLSFHKVGFSKMEYHLSAFLLPVLVRAVPEILMGKFIAEFDMNARRTDRYRNAKDSKPGL